MNRPETWGGHILLAGVAAGVFVCIDLENAGPRNADAFEDSQVEIKTKTKQESADALQVEAKTKQDSSQETVSFNGRVRNADWLSIKFDGSVFDLYPTRSGALTAYGFNMLEPIQKEKTSLTDTRVTLGVWDDWVRWTSRQAVSNYIAPGTDLVNLRPTGVGFNNRATSQRIETGILKTDSMRLSLFADYARVGTYFVAPNFAIKRGDPFSKPNSTTTQLGAIVERGPFTFTLTQSAQQSLAQDNAPILTQNQIGVSLKFDELLGRSGRIPEGMSWVVPASAWINLSRGRMRASLSQGVNGDTTSDVSAGLSWNVGKIYANLGYWQSEYQSQLYPWKGLGINGSLGFYEDQWGIDTYFDVSRSVTPYGLAGMPQSTTQTFDAKYVTSGVRFHITLAP